MWMAVVPPSMPEWWATLVGPGGRHPALDLRNLWSHGTHFLYWLLQAQKEHEEHTLRAQEDTAGVKQKDTVLELTALHAYMSSPQDHSPKDSCVMP